MLEEFSEDASAIFNIPEEEIFDLILDFETGSEFHDGQQFYPQQLSLDNYQEIGIDVDSTTNSEFENLDLVYQDLLPEEFDEFCFLFDILTDILFEIED